jgi:hypothetical protein
MFGTDRLKQVLDAHASSRAAEVVAALIAAVRAFTDHPVDDITVVALKQLTRPVRIGPLTPENALKWGDVTADWVR